MLPRCCPANFADWGTLGLAIFAVPVCRLPVPVIIAARSDRWLLSSSEITRAWLIGSFGDVETHVTRWLYARQPFPRIGGGYKNMEHSRRFLRSSREGSKAHSLLSTCRCTTKQACKVTSLYHCHQPQDECSKSRRSHTMHEVPLRVNPELFVFHPCVLD